jgi:rhodanese-related sulfurtransferase
VSTIERFLVDARRRLDRVEAEDLAAEAAAGALVVDIRPQANRDDEGTLPGAVVIERIHLEWRLDPTSPDRHPDAHPGRKVIVVCNEGFASSLAAWSLRLIGVEATDLVGGFRAWRRRAAAQPSPDKELHPWP